MQPSAVSQAVVSGPHSSTARGVVLFVTADSDLREVASRVLRRQGYHVLTAAHGGHAVLKCLSAPRVDVAVIEISMDDMSGPALTERLRRHYPALRAVYLAQPGTSECECVLVRPFTRDDLLAHLATALAPAV